MAISASFARSAAPRLTGAVALATAIALAAIGLQVHYGLLGDVSWLITVDEKWLDGATPYRDVIEINPPASLLLYWPAVALARLIGVAPEFTVAAFGFLAIAASVGASAAILVKAGLAARVGPVGLGLTLAALAILPGQSFDERDQLALLFGLPFLALAAARASQQPVDAWMALVVGLGAGAMAVVKPPYALVAIAVAPYLARRIGVRALFGCAEFYVAGAVGLAYVTLIGRAFPDYVATVLPLGVELYAPIREPLLALLTGPGVLMVFVIGVATARIAERDLAAPLVAVPALAALGAVGAFLVQGKGWLYQIYPAIALMSVAAGFALDLRPAPPLRAALGALAAIVTALAVLWLARWPLPIAFAAAAGAYALARALTGQERLEAMGVAAAFGAACGLFAMDGIRTPALQQALASLGPHPSVAAISESLAFGHPMVRAVGGVWAQSVPSLWVAAAARRMIDEHPGDAAIAAHMQRFIEADRDRLAADLTINRPDALLVGRLDTRFHQWIWSDPKIAAARADYRLFLKNPDPGFPAALYVRKDLMK
ncbi:MAG: hypothetical protein JO234_06640 [Hyphomicrobiales bacterium]|nr:hypothetical protein [Hyphomicrobiales bacterium]